MEERAEQLIKARRIYVASSWRNGWQPEVVRRLRAHGHLVYDFRNPAEGQHGFSWSECDPDWKSKRTPEAMRDLLAHPRAIDGFTFDETGMEWADTCVLVMPCGNDAHLEAGWFAGRGRRLIVYYPLGVIAEPSLMYRLGGDPKAVIAGSPEELISLVGDARTLSAAPEDDGC